MLTAEEHATVDWILFKAQEASGALNQWEQEFVDAMTDRLEKRGPELVVSDRQWEILKEIRDKAV